VIATAWLWKGGPCGDECSAPTSALCIRIRRASTERTRWLRRKIASPAIRHQERSNVTTSPQRPASRPGVVVWPRRDRWSARPGPATELEGEARARCDRAGSRGWWHYFQSCGVDAALDAIAATALAWRVHDNGTQIEMPLVSQGAFNMGCSAERRAKQLACTHPSRSRHGSSSSPALLGVLNTPDSPQNCDRSAARLQRSFALASGKQLAHRERKDKACAQAGEAVESARRLPPPPHASGFIMRPSTRSIARR